MLFIALIGWNVGLNAGGMLTGLAAVFVVMLGILIPSTTLTYVAAQWGHRNRKLRAVRAFKQGMAPVVVALLISTGWLLALNNTSVPFELADIAINPAWVVAGVATLIVWRTRLHLLWLLGAGALLGWFGLV